MTDPPPLRLKKVHHTWPLSGTRACIDVNLSLHPGTIHALVGENGAGKTTLGHIIAGVRQPDTGHLVRNGEMIDLATRRIGPMPGIGLVRQRSNWPKGLELWEAAILGREGPPTRRSQWLKRFLTTADHWGVGGLEPKASVGSLDVAALQRAQLVASLMFHPEIIILDEPVAAWEDGEFLRLLDRLKNRGIRVLMITHRLNDVFRVADWITVMRHGRIVLSRSADKLGRDEVTARIFGGHHSKHPVESLDDAGGDGANPPSALPRLSCHRVGLRSAGREELTDVTFDVCAGEIVAVTGLSEEGVRGLENLVSGHAEPTTGTMLVEGRPVKGGSLAMRRAGLGYVPSDTMMRGASLTSTVAENMLVLASQRLAKRGWLSSHAVRRWAQHRLATGKIDGAPDQLLRELSGGNIQKLILQRELKEGMPILLIVDPTRGLDEKSRQGIHRHLNRLIARGTAVLLLTSDLDEAMELSHRMGVISRGRLTPIRPTHEWSRPEAAALIVGASLAQAEAPS